MLERFESGIIEQDGRVDAVINGKILKLIVDAPHAPDVMISIYTNDGELMFDNNELPHDGIFYPYNIIERVSGDRYREDYFYNLGFITIFVENLAENDYINNIKIMYER